MANRYKDFSNTIILIIDFIANIVGIVTSLHISKCIGLVIIVLSIIALIIWISIIILNIFKASKAISIYKSKTIEKNINIVAILHNILHFIRDSSSNIEFQSINNVETLDNFFRQLEINMCTNIESMYKQIWNKETCVCIKLLSVDDLYNSDYKSWKLYTFARGNSVKNIKQSGRTRDDNYPVFITDNTDFEIIVEGVIDYFVCENMVDINNYFKKTYNREYHNTRNKKGDITKYYNSTIVLPIRIETKQRKLKNGNCINYHLLGFLCIDTLEPFNKNDKEEFYLGVEYAKAIVDSMYHQILNYFHSRIDIANNAVNKPSINPK